jgi:hypothetical protein
MSTFITDPKYRMVRLPEAVALQLDRINATTGIVRWKIVQEGLEIYEKVFVAQRKKTLMEIFKE